MSGTVVVTGGTGGIGKETARALVRDGRHVVVTGRDAGRAAEAAAELRREHRQARVDTVLGDLSTLAGVRAVADEVRTRFPELGVLVNNAGLLEPRRRLTADGIEAHLAVNVVAPWVLTHELAPLLAANAPARVVTVTGGLPSRRPQPDDLQAERGFLGLITYSRAKAAMEALSLELADDLRDIDVGVLSAFPGTATTTMTAAMSPDMVPVALRPFWPLFRLLRRPDGGRSAARASRSTVRAVVDPRFDGGTGIFLDAGGRARPWSRRVTDRDVRRAIRVQVERLVEGRAQAV